MNDFLWLKDDNFEINYKHNIEAFDYRAELLPDLLRVVVDKTINYVENLPDKEKLDQQFNIDTLWKDPDKQLQIMLETKNGSIDSLFKSIKKQLEEDLKEYYK